MTVSISTKDSSNGGKVKVVRDNKIKYYPPKNISSSFTDTFTYTIKDGHLKSDTGTVNISIKNE